MSPRPSKDLNKIKYVSLVNGRWVYRPYIPKSERDLHQVDRSGFLKPFKLGVAADPWHRILKAHAATVENLFNNTNKDEFTLRWISEKYEQSSVFRNLSDASRKKAKTTRRILDHEVHVNGREGTLGDAQANSLTLPFLRQIREARLDDLRSRGRDGKSQCNREIAYLSAAVQWATEMYDEVPRNTVRGLKALKENTRDRYVTDAEYSQQLELAAQISDYLPVAMELTYLFAARGIEVTDLEIRHTQKTDEDGISVVQVNRRKGSNTTYIQRNERVDAAIRAAMSLHKKRKISGKFLLPGVRGPRLLKSTLDDAMQRLKALMTEKQCESHWTRSSGQ
ncbi:hypothetical protein N9383_07070, partial [Granulosicoccus sp.]|nr:hypothetical protein [Granulosicoccus sp.]